MSSISKKWGQLKQWTGEKWGSTQKTETSEDFKQLQKETDNRKEAIEKVHEKCVAFVRALTNRKKDTDSSPIPTEAMADAMDTFGSMLDHDSTYGHSLVKCGKAHQKIASHQLEFVSSVQFGYIGELERVIGDFKEYTRLKSKLENRRLDFDAKVNKAHKMKKENVSLEEDVRIAQGKYEESLGDISNMMIALNSNEDDQLQELMNLIDAEVDYYQKSLEVLQQLQSDLENVPRNRSSEARLQARRTHSRTDSIYKDDDAPPPMPSRGLTPTSGMSRSASTSNMDRKSTLPSNRVPSSSHLHARDSPSPPPPLPSREPPPPTPSREMQVRVTFDFDAESAEEMSIRVGDIINVLQEIDEGWWVGELADGSGRSGMFPSNYTELIQPTAQAPKPAPPRPRVASSASIGIDAPSPASLSKTNSPNMSANRLPVAGGGGGSQGKLTSGIGSISSLGGGGGGGGGGARGAPVAGPCSTCGCEEFLENAFKPGQCRTCFHKH